MLDLSAVNLAARIKMKEQLCKYRVGFIEVRVCLFKVRISLLSLLSESIFMWSVLKSYMNLNMLYRKTIEKSEA